MLLRSDRMKKLLAVCLAFSILYIVCLCACGNDSKKSAAKPEKTDTTAAAQTTDAAKLNVSEPDKTVAEPKGTQGETTVEDSSLKDMIAQKGSDTGYTGVIYATQNGKQVYAGGEINSVYRVASVSKQFTAAAVLTLSEEGKLNINDTLDRFFPSYAHGAEVTVNHLLHMRSGIPDYVDIGFDGHIVANTADTLTMDAALSNSAEKNRAEILNWILAQDLDFTPDSQYWYCNSNYFLLAEIITQVSGMGYESFIEQRFLTPLQMNQTGFADTWNNQTAVVDADPSAVWLDCKGICYGCGDMVSNAVDLTKWASEFIHNTVLSDNVVALMMEPREKYGCGLIIDDNGFVYHEGDLPPYRSALCVSKSGGFVLAMLDCQQGTSLPTLRSAICADFNNI